MTTTQWLLLVAGLVLLVAGVGGLITSRSADSAAARARRSGCWAALFIAVAALLLAVTDLAPVQWEIPLSVAQIVASLVGSAFAVVSAVRHYRLNDASESPSDTPS
jgi:predicted MFS family arabinose efflux permease